MEKLFPRERFLDSMNKPLTQALFLERGYSEYALYTLKDVDHEYKGHVYPSIKKLYLEIADPTEYRFVEACFLNWRHWLRLCENVLIREHIDEWRSELEIKLRSEAVRQAIDHAKNGTFQAARWLADRGWTNPGAGRPSKSDIEREKQIKAKISEEFENDNIRLFQQKK